MYDQTGDNRAKPRSPPDLAIAEVAARQHGVVTFSQLQAAGLGDRTIRYRKRIGRLHRIHRGVYAIGQPRLPLPGRTLAAALSIAPDAVVSHVSAAVLWGLLTDFGGPVDVTVARRLHPRPGIRLHCVRRLDPRDGTVHDAIPLTSVARTLVDLADTASEPALRRATRQALVQRLVDEPAIRAQLARSNGRRGARRLAALIADGPAPTRSELEDRVLELMQTHGLPRPAVNAVVEGFEVDFLFAAQRVVVEADGARYHDNRIARRSDADKQARLEAAGYRVLRVDWEQVTRRPRQTVQRLARLLE